MLYNRFMRKPIGLLITCLACLLSCTETPALAPPASITLTPASSALPISLTLSANALAPLIQEPLTQELAIAVRLSTANTTTILTDTALSTDNDPHAHILHHIPPEFENHWFTPIAIDGIVPIVHPDNTLTDLSQAQLRAIFSGRISNWSSLGGVDQPITLYVREPESGIRTLFDSRIMAGRPLSILAETRPSPTSIIQAVSTDPYALSYITLASLPAEDADSIKTISLDSIPATPNSLSDQTYPLSTPLYFLSPSEPESQSRQLLAYLQSPAFESAIAPTLGTIPFEQSP